MKNLAALLSPRSIALIGASPDITILRGRTLKVMLGHEYAGKIYPVSRSHKEIQGLKAYPSVDVLPEKVDLAVLIIPAEFVLAELDRCGQAGIKAALILTSGFAEQAGEIGARMQKELREIAARHEMFVLGPNTEGFVNTAAGLCPTFSPVVDALSIPLVPPWRKTGHVAVIAQSGGVGFAFFDRGRPKELPFSYVVTTGNEACLEVFDIVEYLIDEGRSDVFLLFIENIKNAETFKRAADKAFKAGKPIIVTKIGHSEAGQRAAASHTAALAGTYQMYRAMFRHYGIIEGGDVDEMVDLAAAFSFHREKLPAGKRVGIGTPSGGAGGWMADACHAVGLTIPELDRETRMQIDAHLPAYGTSQNPVDCTAQAIRELGYAEMARMIASSPAVDSVVMIASTRGAELLERDQEKLRRLAASDKPILFYSYTQPCAAAIKILSETGHPLFTNMRNCARAIDAIAQYRKRREQYCAAARDEMPDEARRSRIRRMCTQEWLCEYQVTPILSEYGIATVESRLVRSAEEAVAFARLLNAPVALKIQSPDIPHKTDLGGVMLNLAAEDVCEAYETLVRTIRQRAPHATIHGVLAQRMARKGIEFIIGLKRDELFGPMLTLGFGGTFVELLRDVISTPAPATLKEVRALLDELRGRILLDGMRGAPPSDVDALIDVVVRFARCASENRDILLECELNPVVVHAKGEGVSVVDALAKCKVSVEEE